VSENVQLIPCSQNVGVGNVPTDISILIDSKCGDRYFQFSVLLILVPLMPSGHYVTKL
jgi:hypothetical protein